METKHELKNRFMHVEYVEGVHNENVNYGGSDVFSKKNETINEKNETINEKNETINEVVEQLSAKFSASKIKKIEKILVALSANSYITYGELVEEVGIGRSTVSRYLKDLKELGVVKRVGANKNGLWIINNDFK